MTALSRVKKTGLFVASTALISMVTACGAGDTVEVERVPADSAPTSEAPRPAETDLASLLPTQKDTVRFSSPDGFFQTDASSDSPPNESDLKGTCLEDLSKLGPGAPAPLDTAEVKFEELDRAAQVDVLARVSKYDSEESLASTYDAFAASFKECSTVTETSVGGQYDYTYDLTVVGDDDGSLNADAQLHIVAEGSLTALSETSNAGYYYHIVRSGPYLAVVAVSYVGADQWDASSIADTLAPELADSIADLPE